MDLALTALFHFQNEPLAQRLVGLGYFVHEKQVHAVDSRVVYYRLGRKDGRPIRELQRELRDLFHHQGIFCDPILQDLPTARTPKGLAVFDMDSTLIQAEVIDEYGRELGMYDQIAEITASAMRGEIGFNESFTRRMALLKGLKRSQTERVWERIQVTPGAGELFAELKKRDIRTALLTGGFRHIAEQLQKLLHFDHLLCNEMIFGNDTFTGVVQPPIVNGEAKAAELERLRYDYGLQPSETLAVGDGANDIPMLVSAGLGVAYHAKPKVVEAVGNAITHNTLHPLTHLLDFPL